MFDRDPDTLMYWYRVTLMKGKVNHGTMISLGKSRGQTTNYNWINIKNSKQLHTH